MTEYELPLIYISPSFGNKKRKRFDANVGGVFFSGDTEQEAREKAEQYIRDHGWFSFAEVERIKAQGALEEFDYVKANRPVDPVYWDIHHRAALQKKAGE